MYLACCRLDWATRPRKEFLGNAAGFERDARCHGQTYVQYSTVQCSAYRSLGNISSVSRSHGRAHCCSRFVRT